MWFLHSVEAVGREIVEGLHRARRPADHCLLDLRILAQAEVQAAVILRCEAVAAGDLLQLLFAVPIQGNLRANGAAIALRAFERELDPVDCPGATVFL